MPGRYNNLVMATVIPDSCSWPGRCVLLLLFGRVFTRQLTHFLRVLMPYNSPLDSLSCDRTGRLLLKANILIFVYHHLGSLTHLTWFLFQLVRVASHVKWIPSYIIIIVITWSFVHYTWLNSPPSRISSPWQSLSSLASLGLIMTASGC